MPASCGERLVLGFSLLFGPDLLVDVGLDGRRVVEDLDAFGKQPAVEAVDRLDVVFGVRKHRHDVVRQHESLISALIEQTGNHRCMRPID